MVSDMGVEGACLPNSELGTVERMKAASFHTGPDERG